MSKVLELLEKSVTTRIIHLPFFHMSDYFCSDSLIARAHLPDLRRLKQQCITQIALAVVPS